MAKTIEQIQTMITSKADAREVINEIADYLQANPPGNGGGASYLVYAALLDQSGTNAPVEALLENTLGRTISWAYSGSDGIYIGTFDVPLGASAYSKAFPSVTNNFGAGYNYSAYFNGANADSVSIEVSDLAGNMVNGKLSSSGFKIELYP